MSSDIPACCASLHVPLDRLRETVEAEKARGKWECVDVERAIQISKAARPCNHYCHRAALTNPGDDEGRES